MAIPSKKEIDFDVYQRQDPASTVDWGKAAKDITKTFEGIRDTRQAKKDAIEIKLSRPTNSITRYW